jgi:hypothetical protein
MRLLQGVVGLAIWEFGWILAYVFLSQPFASLLAGIVAAGQGTDAASHLNSLQGTYAAVFGICFVIAVLGGIAWFILWVSRREYETQMYRY